MSTQRDRQFPATSIGRSSGPRVVQSQQSDVVHDSAHPLLLTPSAVITSSDSNAPKYLPYTPRQRVAAAATTTGTIVHPPPSPQHQGHGNATTKLQVMHLKAAAQNLGLDTSTIGWAILEKLVAFNEGDEWNEIWNLVTAGKATLLLPLEQHSNNASLTSEFVKDHIAFIDSSSLVTASGLRGSLTGDVFTIRSTISPSSKIYHDLTTPSTRSSAFTLLPPLPTTNESTTYPSFAITSECTTLPLPPRAQAHNTNQKSQTSRTTGRGASGSGAPTASRIPNPFASLFGSKPTSPTPVTLPATSPPASIRSFDSSSQDRDASMPIDIQVYTIDRKVTRNDVAKEINKALKGEIKRTLLAPSSDASTPTPIPIPSWVVDRVYEFSIDWFPFVRRRLKATSPNGHGRGGDSVAVYEVNTLEESSDNSADRLQEFMLLLEQDLHAAGTFIVRNRSRDSEADLGGVEKQDEKREREEGREIETRIREVMELVERLICSMFYDRLFMQPTTDDASHDEALTSRIAALNMLDLTLGHLDVVVGEAEKVEVGVVVKACGELLSQIDACRCPADKAAILVAAHKVMVDGLTRLPPIRLKTDGDEEEDPQTAKPSNAHSQHQPPPLSEAPTLDDAALKPSVSQDITPSPLSMTTTNLPDTSVVEEKTEDRTESVSAPPPSSNARAVEKKGPPPKLTLETTKDPTPVSGDILLPMLIFSVAKTNPPRLLSNLLFTQRFRNYNFGGGGEESYCLINLMAVAEFLENVDLEALGLGGGVRVLSAADLTPIPLPKSPANSEPEKTLEPGGLRGRVEQQVDAIADSANKVISGVVDSSFGILRSFLPNQGANTASTTGVGSQHGGSRPTTPGAVSDAGDNAEGSSSWRSQRSNFGLLRNRESGFSLRSITASLPGRSRSNTAGTEELGQQLVTVSRPGSVKARSRAGSRSSRASLKIRIGGESSESETGSDSESVTTTTTDEDDHDGDGSVRNPERESEDEEDAETRSNVGGGDAKSIKSFESMMAASSRRSKSREERRKRRAAKENERGGSVPSAIPIAIPTPGTSPSNRNNERKSLSDRLARVSSTLSMNAKTSPHDPHFNSLLLQPPSKSQPHTDSRRLGDSPASSRSPSPVHSPRSRLPVPLQPALPPAAPVLRLAPPLQKFMNCNPGDLRLSEVGELLRDYQRLVDGIRAVHGFDHEGDRSMP